MATRRELTKAYAWEYRRASKKAKGVMLDELCAATGWSRVNARRAIRRALARKGRAGAQPRTPRPRKYSYDALKVLTQVWTLSGEPCGIESVHRLDSGSTVSGAVARVVVHPVVEFRPTLLPELPIGDEPLSGLE